MPDDPPEVVKEKWVRFSSHDIKCMGCAAHDAQARAYEQKAATLADGRKILDRDGIHHPVVRVD